MSLRKYLLKSVDLRAKVGFRFRVSSSHPRLFLLFRRDGGAVGAFATHMEDVLGCGEQDVLTKIRVFPENHFGTLKVRESPFVRVGVELSHEGNSLAKLTEDELFYGGSETPCFLTGTSGCTAHGGLRPAEATRLRR